MQLSWASLDHQNEHMCQFCFLSAPFPQLNHTVDHRPQDVIGCQHPQEPGASLTSQMPLCQIKPEIATKVPSRAHQMDDWKTPITPMFQFTSARCRPCPDCDRAGHTCVPHLHIAPTSTPTPHRYCAGICEDIPSLKQMKLK